MSTQHLRHYTRMAVVVAVVLSVAAGPAVAQPQPPHKIYGTVTDQNGDAVNGETVTVTYSGNQIASTATDSNGDYEVQMSDPDSGESSESLTIKVKDTTKSTTWESAKSERIDFSVTVNTGGGDDGSTDPPSGGNGGGGAEEEEQQQEEQQQEEQQQEEQQQEETPTVEEVRETLDQTEPNTETRSEIVDNDPDSPGTNINPEGTVSVEQITIDNEEATGSIDVREWQDPPEQVAQSIAGTIQNNEEVTEEVAEEVDLDEQVSLDEGDTGDGDTSDSDTGDGDTGDGDTSDGDTGDGDTEVTAQVVTAADIDPAFDEAESSSASVTMTASREDLEDPQEAVIVHETEDSWEVLETNVEERGEDEIVLAGDVESFSLFAVAEIEATETESTGDGTSETDDGTETDSGGSGLIIVGLLAVVAVAGAALYARSNDML